MTAPAIAVEWRSALAWLAIMAAFVLLLFASDATDITAQWWHNSTFGHCLLIGPIIGWLVWLRIAELARLRPRPWLAGLLWIAGGAVIWLVGEAAGAALLRHAGLVIMLQGLVPTLLGPQVTMGLLFPLAYAFFLIPLGEELVPPMQLLTADMAMMLLRLTGIPAYLDGIYITTPVGLFAVAEACSGVKFLIAMAALSVLAAHLCFTRMKRRLIFVLFALTATVLANGVRAFGTIWMAENWGMSMAMGADHLVYGWIFFACVMALVFFVARPWFDRSPDAVMIDADRLRNFLPGAGPARLLQLALTCALISAAPAWLMLASSDDRALPLFTAPAIAGWIRVDPPAVGQVAWRARFAGADRRADWQFVDGRGRRVDVTIAGYRRQGEGREIVGFGQGAVDPDGNWRRARGLAPEGVARMERIAITGATRDVLTLYRVNGRFTGSPALVKWHTLRARIGAGDQRAYALVISAEAHGALSGEAQVRSLVAAAGGVNPLMRRLTQGD